MADENVTCEEKPIEAARIDTAKYIAAFGMKMKPEDFKVGEVYSLVYTDDPAEIYGESYYANYTCRTFAVLGIDSENKRVYETMCATLYSCNTQRVMLTKDLLAWDLIDPRVAAKLNEVMGDEMRTFNIIRNALHQ